MKEVTAIIRMNMISKTKNALLKEGFSSLTCRKVLGRGKKKVDFSVIDEAISEGTIFSNTAIEEISEIHRLVVKRLVTVLVKDEDVQKVVNTIIDANRTNSPGDGKIFVTNVTDVVRVRTAETGTAAL
ncbi:P-II family nitrogen regulator [Clostridium akagii]|uniref:P-II family nitrogen regulator n=1 Tax=Clostridium akagii TaxID=91623 RepID=UPI00047BA891|nr:P-II family nitrogen regulator [Clostridium akagii]